MNQRLLTVFVFALVVASAASFLVYRAVSSRMTLAPHGQATHLLVSSRDLEVGSLVAEADIHPVEWQGPSPEQLVSKREDIIGRGVISKIYKDEPFLAARLAAHGAGAGMAATIPVGMRAVALRVNDVIGLAGFVMPGMHVDVIVSGTAPQSANAGTVSRTVLQNIEVLSAGQKIERTVEGKPEDAQVVNLMVTPDQAEVLSLASNEAKIQLVLRNPLDTRSEVTHGASVAALFGGVQLAAPVARTAPVPPRMAVISAAPLSAPASERPVAVAVEVFSGTKRSEAVVTGSN